ncbi:MAG: hypothetical protein M9921_14175 [Fimbriimonadaceae bacterium]|nr:hypothetical protein [Fimbriimonadaceae bacterium]
MRPALRTLGLCGAAVVVASLVLAALSRGDQALGFALGAGLAMFSIGSFAALAWLVGQKGGASSGFAGFATVVFLIKLPLYWVAITFAIRLGDSAMACFLAGLGLVYSVLVLLALLDSRMHREGPFY